MEQIAKHITLTVSHALEILAAVIVGIAVLQAIWNYILSFTKINYVHSKEAIRVQFGSSVAVALELMLGADVLATAVAPGWGELGKLAAIAIIRTALNFFLEREMKHIKEMKLGSTTEMRNQHRA